MPIFEGRHPDTGKVPLFDLVRHPHQASLPTPGPQADAEPRVLAHLGVLLVQTVSRTVRGIVRPATASTNLEATAPRPGRHSQTYAIVLPASGRGSRRRERLMGAPSAIKPPSC